MNENLFKNVNIKMENTHVLDGSSEDPERTCREFEEAIERAGGIDLQLLVIGLMGVSHLMSRVHRSTPERGL